jgi:hypothetical protein
MPSSSPINLNPTPEQRCEAAVLARMNTIVSDVRTYLAGNLNNANLRLNMGGTPVMNDGVVAEGFANVTGLTQPHLTSTEREARLAALIAHKTTQALRALLDIMPRGDYEDFIRSFGIEVAAKLGDPGVSPGDLKAQSEHHLRSRLTAEVESLVRGKFNSLEASYLSPNLPPAPPATDPEVRRLLEENLRAQQEAARIQKDQAEQALKQQEQQAKKSPEQEKAAEIQAAIKKQLTLSKDCTKDLTHREIYKWIEEALRLTDDGGRMVERLKNTGLIKYQQRANVDPDTGSETNSYIISAGKITSDYFKTRRFISLCSWGATAAATASVLMLGAPLGAAGLGAALGMACVANGINMGVQAFLRKLHTNAFTQTWKEIQSELDTNDMKRVPALAGLMYLLVDKYSPVIFLKNQTKLWQWGQPMSTDAVLDHLKEAAAAALKNLEGNAADYAKVTDVGKKIQLAKTGLENLEKRWNWHWEMSSWWSSALTTTSFFGTLICGASAIA